MDWDGTSITYITFEVITGLVTVFGNTVVLIAIIKTSQLHTVTNVFIGNLAVADIFVGLFVAPLAALSFLGLPRDVYGCIFVNCAILMLTNISILMLLAVAVERFIAIRLPYAYNRLMTIQRALLLNGCIWIFGSLLGLIPMYGWNVAPESLTSCSFTGVISLEYMVYFQFFGLIVLPIFAMLIIYIYILFVIRKHTKQNDALQKMFNKDRRIQKQWKKDVRAAKFFAMLIILFGIFWLPVNILNCVTLFCPTCDQRYELLLGAIVLSHANSSMNPFLYAASNSRIQQAVTSLFNLSKASHELSIEVASGYIGSCAIANTSATNRGISTISNIHNERENSKEQSGLTVPLGSDSLKIHSRNIEYLPSTTQMDPKVTASYYDIRGQAFDPPPPSSTAARTSLNVLRKQIGQKPDMVNRSILYHSSNYRENQRRNNTNFSTDYVTNGVQDIAPHILADEQNDSTYLPTAHSKSLGRVNFSFVDDDEHNLSTTFSPKRELKIRKINDDINTEIREMSDHQCKMYVGNTVLEKADDVIDTSSEEKRHEVSSNTNQKISESPLQEDSISQIARQSEALDIALHTESNLFVMEDEPLHEQESNKIIYVAGQAYDDNISSEEGGQQEPANSPHKLIKHSYFCSQDIKNSSTITDVEI